MASVTDVLRGQVKTPYSISNAVTKTAALTVAGRAAVQCSEQKHANSHDDEHACNYKSQLHFVIIHT